MENITLNEKVKEEQTGIGKFLGWFFGLILSLAIFSISEKEVGIIGLWIALIGILLLPPVNMHLRKKYHHFVKKQYGEKYNLTVINLGYTSIKTVFIIVLLFICAAVSTSSSEPTTGLTQENEKIETAQVQSIDKPKLKVSKEFKNALTKAEIYSKTMHMSKQAIYDQLTSEYGEQFPADAAQYAIDNMNADFQINALMKAKLYQETMSMSTSAIYDQLISEFGEKFTVKEAQYAIEHLND